VRIGEIEPYSGPLTGHGLWSSKARTIRGPPGIPSGHIIGLEHLPGDCLRQSRTGNMPFIARPHSHVKAIQCSGAQGGTDAASTHRTSSDDMIP